MYISHWEQMFKMKCVWQHNPKCSNSVAALSHDVPSIFYYLTHD